MEEKNYYRYEVKLGSFYQAMTLPLIRLGETKQKQVIKEGVLKIEIPRAEKVKSKN